MARNASIATPPALPPRSPVLRLSAQTLPTGVQHLARVDARLASVIDRVGPCRLRLPRGQIYRSLFRSVLYQQLAGPAAAAIERRVRACCGGEIPAPAAFLRVRTDALRRAGLSRQKLAYLRDLADAFAAGRLRPHRLARLHDAALIAEVTTVHGIGVWTAHMLLIFSLGRSDVLPVGDYGVRKAMQRLYGLPELPDAHTMEQLAMPWRPYRSIAAWYLWRSLDDDAR